MKQFIIGHYQYQENHLIGEGSTGKVYVGIDAHTNQKVAIKAIQLQKMNNDIPRYLLTNEKMALKQITNPYVLKLYDIREDRNYCFIITQYCQNGSLADYIQHKRRIPQKQAMLLLRKIAIGLKAIHQKNFVHRDMKPQNIMLRNQDPVIIDFGYSQYLFGLKPLRKYNVGSPAYMSPQAYLNSKYSIKSDIWALGVIFHQMLTSEVLDEIAPMKQFFEKTIARGSVKIQHQFSKQVMKILASIFHINPQKRVSIGELIKIIDGCLGQSRDDYYSQHRIKRGTSQYIKGVPYNKLKNIQKSNAIRVESIQKDSYKFIQSPNRQDKNNIHSEKTLQKQEEYPISPIRKIGNLFHKKNEISTQTHSPQINRYLQAHSEKNINYGKSAFQLISIDPQQKQEIQNPRYQNSFSSRKFNKLSNLLNDKLQQPKYFQNSSRTVQLEKKYSNQQLRQNSLTKLNDYHTRSFSQKKFNIKGLSNKSTQNYVLKTPIRMDKQGHQHNYYQSQSPVHQPQLTMLRNHIKYGEKYHIYH